MPTSPLSVVIQHLRADLGPEGDGITDGELLSRFVRSRDADALAALVRRHASLVWGVCRRLLNHNDAEDAFQATFLVLVRKATSVPQQAVANWLYGVARQTAVRLLATAAKRGRRETQMVDIPEPTMPEVRDADSQNVVDEELSRLPDHYRGVVVLCDLEGMTRKEAARQLGIPEGSVASRLARARALLAKRLAGRGVVFSGGSVAAVLSAGSASSAPPALVASTIKAATLLAAGQAAGVVSVKVAVLTEGVVQAMFVTKIKSVLAVVLVAAVAFGGVTLTGKLSGQPPIPSENQKTPAQPSGKAKADEGTVVLDVRVPDGGTVLLRVKAKADERTVKTPDGGTVLLGGKQTAAERDDKKPTAETPQPSAKTPMDKDTPKDVPPQPSAETPVDKDTPKDVPPPATDKRAVLTPEEAMRLAGGTKATVEFKVAYVGKSILVKTDGGKDAGWATGHGPDDMCLRPKAVLKTHEGRGQAMFEAILAEKAITQLKRAGVTDVGKHLQSKTVRVTGQISWSYYRGEGGRSIAEVVITDLSQLEVVD